MKKRISLIWILAFGIASIASAAEGTWTMKADMPTARMLLGTCVLDGKIYAIGGAPRPHVPISVVEAYDPVTDTWERKADMPTARAGLGTSVVNGKIYAIGGAELNVGTVEEYNPGTDTWTRKTDMPTARGFLTTSVVNGNIYAIGGSVETDGPFFSAVEEYDPTTGTWTRKTDMPEPRYLHTAGVVNGKIYVIAGSPRNMTASNAVFEYDPATDAWTRKADAPTVRSWQSPTAGVVDGRIYVMGGDFGPPDAEVEEYDPATDTWTARADMPTPRGALSITALNDRIYVIGGSITLFNDSLSTVEEYDPEPPLVVDFNGDGIVDASDMCIMIDHWGENYSLCDIGPMPWGDGIVDVQDLIVLSEHLFEIVNDPTLVAHWPLDEAQGIIAYDNAADCDGTLMNGPVWQSNGGMVAGALQFDGIDDYVSTDFVLNPADGAFSVFAWIKGGAPGQVVLSQMGRASWLCTDPVEGCLMTELAGPGRGSGPLRSQAVITDGEWHRIGFVWDGSNRTLYVDNIAVAEGTQNGLWDSVNGLYIGTGSAMQPGTYFSGLIDDIRIYNRAVSP